jgi:hypothetical protein
VLALDEARFGLKGQLRRRWCPAGVRPPWPVHDRYRWTWLYTAVEPATGWSCSLLLPDTDAECLDVFLRHLRRELGPGRAAVVLDGAGSHQSGHLAWPEDLAPLRLPRYSPELNPAEGVFRLLRGRLSNRVFDDLPQMEDELSAAICGLAADAPALQRLTNYPWWRAGTALMQSRSP